MTTRNDIRRLRTVIANEHSGRCEPSTVASAMRQLGMVVSDATVLDTLDDLRRNSVGAGALDDLLALPGLTDLLVNGPEEVFVDCGEGLERVDGVFSGAEEVRHLATRLAAMAGRRLDDARPFVDARLTDGTRLHAVLAPLAEPGPCISLRIPAKRSFSLDDLCASGSVHGDGARLLRDIMISGLAFLVSGGTGTGKTTLLAAMLAEVPARERIVVVEDSRELRPNHPHCVRLERRIANAEGAGEISLTELVRQALRMRPDRLVVGEVRGAELCDLLTALNTGHEGGCGTVHANSVTDVPARLEALAALGGMGRDACHAQIASALQLGIHVRRAPDGSRYIDSIGSFRREHGGEVRVVEAVRLTPAGLVWGVAGTELKELLR